MWIKSTREAHAGNAFRDTRVAELNDGDAVSFSDTGTAQVSAEVGDYLTAEYDAFEATDAGAESDADADTDESDDDADEAAATDGPQSAEDDAENNDDADTEVEY